MASLSSSLEIQTKSKPRPLMLKDFLRDDPNSSSNDFHSFPRRPDSTVRKLLEIDLDSGDAFTPRRLTRSRSKAAASTTISAFQKASEAVINAVKHFPFSSVKSPHKQGILPRSLSQTLSRSFRKKNEIKKCEIRARSVRVRDIMRWKSFGEEEEKKKSVDLSRPINTSISSSSSWAESDFTSDFLQSSSGGSDYSAENERTDGKRHDLPEKSYHKRCCVGEDSVEISNCYGQTKVKQQHREESKGELESPYEEKQQLSPVSVLDFPYEDEEIETPSSFEDSLANMERTKQQLLQKIRQFERLAHIDPVDLEQRIAQSELEEEEEKEEEDDGDETIQAEDKAWDLLKLFKASTGKSHKRNVEKVLVDFFREGLVASERNVTRQEEAKSDGFEEELLRAAMDWMNGCVAMGWSVDDNREAYVKEMSRDGGWKRLKEEEEEALAVEMEIVVLGSLVEEVLLDLFLD